MIGNHPFVKWAIKVIEARVRDGIAIQPDPERLPRELFETKAGAFVTIHTADGKLRGCIGTFLPTNSNLAYEIMQNAVSSALEDPRFEPVRPDELKDLAVSVDVLSAPQEVKGEEDLDPGVYGVIVESGWKRGLLLPDLDGVDTPREQIRIASLKAGIRRGEKTKLYRFTVKRYH